MTQKNDKNSIEKNGAFPIMIVFSLICILVVTTGIIWYANWKIPRDTKLFVYDSATDIPPSNVALVLGASKNLSNGRPNPYFVYRINAAKELYDSGKIKAFVLSGDNSRHDYNEPQDMKDKLVRLGVPEKIIYLDYAGLRTLDSVVRINKIFGQNEFIVVSQQFHNERAIFIAQYFGLTAYGYNAKDLNPGRFSYKTKIREKFARVKVFVDIFTGKEPKFLGEPVIIDNL